MLDPRFVLGRSCNRNLGAEGPHSLPHPLWEGILSVQAISWVIEHSKQKANPFVVLLMVANHARSDGSGAWPSIHTLAKECRLGDRTVQRAIVSLAKSGELRVYKNKGPYGANLYDLPGVKLTPGGVNLDREECQSEPILDATAVSPNPSLTVPKDKEAGAPFQTMEEIRERVAHKEREALDRFKQQYPSLAGKRGRR